MKNTEKIFIPLGIGAAVLGIWAALRNKPVAPVSGGGSVNIPPLPPLQSNEYGVPGGMVGNSPYPGGANPQYFNLSVNNPLSPNPAQPDTHIAPSNYEVFNLPPWIDWTKFLASQTSPITTEANGASKSCGCGGGCGVSANVCDQTVNPKVPDGHGSCLTTRPKTLPMELMEQNQAAMYLAASPYDCGRTNSMFDVNCRSLFQTVAVHDHFQYVN